MKVDEAVGERCSLFVDNHKEKEIKNQRLVEV